MRNKYYQAKLNFVRQKDFFVTSKYGYLNSKNSITFNIQYLLMSNINLNKLYLKISSTNLFDCAFL